MAVINFNASKYEPAQEIGAVPPGEYSVQAIDSEMSPTRDGKGERLSFTYQIQEGEYKGRHIFDGFNMKNASEKAVEISMRQLTALCHAVGFTDLVPDSSMLHGKPFIVKVGVRAAQGQYEAQNIVKAYKKADGTEIKNGNFSEGNSSHALDDKSSDQDNPPWM